MPSSSQQNSSTLYDGHIKGFFTRQADVLILVVCLLMSALIGGLVTMTMFGRQGRSDMSTADTFDLPQDPSFHMGGTREKMNITSRPTVMLSGSPEPKSRGATPEATVRPPQSVLTEDQHFGKVFTQGKLYYRAAYLDENKGYLFVGAMDKLFRLNLDDISSQPFKELHLPAPNKQVEDCKRRALYVMNQDIDCRNHIHEVHPIRGGNTLYICGTNAVAPTDWQVNATDLALLELDKQVRIGQQARGRPQACPFYVHQNTSALWIDDAPVKGTSIVVALHAAERQGDNYYITRTEAYNQNSGARLHSYLTTRSGGITMLNKPHSAGTLSLGEHLYFAFREDALEREACGIRVTSRLARICKGDKLAHEAVRVNGQASFENDLGGPIDNKMWSSFVKLRLQCIDTSVRQKYYPEYFIYEGIYDTSWVPNLDGGLLFGAFVTLTNGYPDSAVCAFRLVDIEHTFASSAFFETYEAKPYMVSKREKNVPSPRPGIGCAPNSATQPIEGPQFLAKHPLLFDPAPQLHNRTFFVRHGYKFSSLSAFVMNATWGTWLVCYVATEDGTVMKLVQEYVTGNQVPNPAILVDSFVVSAEPIRKLLVSLKRNSLYVFSDSAIRQYRLDACERCHLECVSCVRDPFCGWDGTRCLPYSERSTAPTKRTC